VEANPAGRQELSDGWHKYFGFRIPADEIVCDGCRAENPRLIDKTCPVRPCVMEHGFPNCSQCPDYACEKLRERFVVYEDLTARTPSSIPPEDRNRFIRPYENKRRLDQLRRSS